MYLYEDGGANFRLPQALEEMLGNRLHNGLELLRDHVETTCGYRPLAFALGCSSPAANALLKPAGNPRARSLFAVIAELQQLQGCVITVELVRAKVDGTQHPGLD